MTALQDVVHYTNGGRQSGAAFMLNTRKNVQILGNEASWDVKVRRENELHLGAH